jgi:tRNA(Glu) U13 pseudouridine synthase TruD
VIPGNIKTIKEDEDEMNSGKIKLVISFSLPPGSYATFLLKTLI